MEYRHPGSPSVKKFKTLTSAAKVGLTIFWDASGVLYTEFLTKELTVNSDRYCAALRSLKHCIRKIRPEKSFFCITTTQAHDATQHSCTNTGLHGKTEIHSGFTASLQPRFGTARLLFVPKIEKVNSFNGCRSLGSHAQPTRIFLHERNEEMDRTIEQISC
ncbi:hypothetical protein TNCV_1581511 [Trichonephila clavipes]|nr:hypothetical protein TNCV_1581511 [Trichonephila clavipes]